MARLKSDDSFQEITEAVTRDAGRIEASEGSSGPERRYLRIVELCVRKPLQAACVSHAPVKT
jgi:hypothetical protein